MTAAFSSVGGFDGQKTFFEKVSKRALQIGFLVL